VKYSKIITRKIKKYIKNLFTCKKQATKFISGFFFTGEYFLLTKERDEIGGDDGDSLFRLICFYLIKFSLHL